MRSRFARTSTLTLLFALGLPGLAGAQPARDAAAPRDPSRDPRTPAQKAAKGPLPDPLLLDGSKFDAEKRSEYGMLGEFDMPGDEKSKSDRVGQSSESPGLQSGSQDPNAKGGSGSAEGSKQGASQQAGGQNGQESATGGGSQAIEQNGAQGTPDGQQVAQMQGNAQAGQAGQSGSKPQQVALGDQAMQIKPQANVPNVVGAQQQPVGKETPQQYDKNTPGGSKQSPGRGNQGVEKGRVMPAGI